MWRFSKPTPNLTVNRDGVTVLNAIDYDLDQGTVAFGAWLRLEIAGSALDREGRVVRGFGVLVYDGRVAVDYVGKSTWQLLKETLGRALRELRPAENEEDPGHYAESAGFAHFVVGPPLAAFESLPCSQERCRSRKR